MVSKHFLFDERLALKELGNQFLEKDKLTLAPGAWLLCSRKEVQHVGLPELMFSQKMEEVAAV